MRTRTRATQRGHTPLIDALKIVLPSVVVTAIGFAALRPLNRMFQPAVLAFATSAAIGLVAGFTTRWSLRNRSGLLRCILAWSMTVTGLVVVALVTQREAGLVLIHATPDLAWKGLGQIMVGISSTMLALRAWHRPASELPEPPERAIPSRRKPARRAIPNRPQIPLSTRPHRHLPRTTEPAFHRPIIALPRWGLPSLPRWQPRLPALARPRIHLPALWRSHVLTFPRVTFRLPRIAFPRGHSRTSARASRPALRVSAQEEHRCPYCLDGVEKNDPRGVRVCPICHSWQHGDCWSITGTCQVPHYQV